MFVFAFSKSVILKNLIVYRIETSRHAQIAAIDLVSMNKQDIFKKFSSIMCRNSPYKLN